MEEKIKKAYTEVLEVLKHISKNEKEKIPNEVIDYINQNKNRFYKFEFKGIDSLSKNASIMLVDLYMTYIADDNEKQIMSEIMELNEKKKKLLGI